MLYLAGKDGDLLDDTGSFVLQQLLNDVGTDGTGPNDGEVCVSRHELTLRCVGDFWGYRCFALLYLSSSWALALIKSLRLRSCSPRTGGLP